METVIRDVMEWLMDRGGGDGGGEWRSCVVK